MTSLVNAPDDLVREALVGLGAQHPELDVRLDPALVTRRPVADKVAIVSGGGSGHEPLHTGYVGPGMLDAAVPGAVFASPTAAQVRDGVLAVDRGRGVLLVVKNYTGDRLNFAIGAELAADRGTDVRTVVVEDDLATEGTGPGRRGTAAVVLVEKIAGAAAEDGADLDTVAALAQRVADGARSLALAFRACAPPGRAEPAFTLGDGEIEFGVGIHGERGTGVRRTAPADRLVASLADPVADAIGLRAGDEVIAIVNGLGSTHPLELSVAHRGLLAHLDGRGVSVARALVGTHVTALDMAGLSITLLRADEQLLRLWDAPVRTPALNWGDRR